MSAKKYDYSPIFRMIEILSILVFLTFFGLLSQKTFQAKEFFLWGYASVFFGITFFSFLAADLVSGIVHFLADTFGTEKTPVLGSTLIRPFRDHHIDPLGITRHDFIETNGSNCLVSLPVLIPCYFFVPTNNFLGWGVATFIQMFLLNIFLTNQFHKWAHLPEPPFWILWLQKYHLILPHQHHQVHHTPPFNTYYCITVGWLNPILLRIGFFPWLKRIFHRIFPRLSMIEEG